MGEEVPEDAFEEGGWEESEYSGKPIGPAPSRPEGNQKSADSSPGEIWEDCKGILRPLIPDGVWASTFEQIKPLRRIDGSFCLAVPNEIVMSKLETEGWRNQLNYAVKEVTKWEKPPMLIIDPAEFPDNLAEDRPRSSRKPTGKRRAQNDPDNERLNPEFTFENFVEGDKNRFAAAAAKNVAENPGGWKNPLFFYGDSGLGKTHLLQAVAMFVKEHYPHLVVRYVTSEQFLNKFIWAIRTQNQEFFTNQFRNVDFLLIDDVQFFDDKEKVKEELFHTFNDLYQAGRQIVLAADRHPNKFENTAGRIKSRFVSGLLIDIEPPDMETRIAILQIKAGSITEMGDGTKVRTEIPYDVLEFIASKFSKDIREMEGALKLVLVGSKLLGKDVSLPFAQEQLKDVIGHEKVGKVFTPEEILLLCGDYLGYAVDELVGPRRYKGLAGARHVSMYIMREVTSLSYPEIGQIFEKDHSTVITAYNKIDKDMSEDTAVYNKIVELLRLVKQKGLAE